MLALIAFYAVSRAPLTFAASMGCVLVLVLEDQEWPGLLTLAVPMLIALALLRACTWRVLPTTGGGRRAVQDVCWQLAEGVADRAGWPWVDPLATDPEDTDDNEGTGRGDRS